MISRILSGLMLCTVFLHLGLVEEIPYASGERRDPFLALITPDGKLKVAPGPKGEFVIEGIIFDPSGASLVLINGEFYKEGETVEEANVISIMKDRVILSQEDEDLTLWLRDEIVEGRAL